jgi:hypothetical protein
MLGRSALLGASGGNPYGNWTGNYSDVSLLLRNETPALVPFDESPTPKTITSVGNAGISTTVFKYGTSSLAFDGNGDYLTSPISSEFEFGTGDFTVECWVRFNSFLSNYWYRMAGIGNGAYGGSPKVYTGWSLFYADGLLYWYRYDGTEPLITRSWTPATNTWYHVAVSRSGTSLRLFVDGSQLGATATNSTSYNRVNNEDLFIGYGSRALVDNFLNGYIDDLRITRNFARYVKNFLPPPAQLPAI